MPMKRVLTFAVVLLSFAATIPAEAQYAVGNRETSSSSRTRKIRSSFPSSRRLG